MVNIFSWLAITSGVAIIFPQALLAIVINYDPMYQIKAWHVFLVYQATNILCLLHNIFTANRTMWIFNAICKSSNCTEDWKPPASLRDDILTCMY
jgi:choline transport protein